MEQQSLQRSNNNVVTKSNSLIEANYKLSVTEQKIIVFIIGKIRQNDDDFKMYDLPIRQFCELIGYNANPKYSDIKQITKGLMSKIIEIKEGKTTKQLSWLSYVEYNENEGTVKLSFDPRLKPYLLELKKEFTSYKLMNVMELKSGYSIRIYEILKKWQAVKKVEIPLVQLRKMVGAVDVYPEYHNFKKRVLKPTQEEISEKTDLFFEYEEIKKGRKVDVIRFIIHSKDKIPLIQEHELIDEHDDWFESLHNQLSGTFKKYDYTFTKEILQRWINLAETIWGDNKYVEINKLTQQAFQASSIENHLAFITYILNEKVKCIQNGTSHQLISVETHSKKTIREEMVPDWLKENNGVKEEKKVNKMILEQQKKELMEKVKNLSKSPV